VLASTRPVGASVCWCVYIAAALTTIMIFACFASDPFTTGLVSIVLSTLTIYVFSLACSNTSLYDPAWCLLPIFTALGWMATAGSSSSPRAIYALTLLLVWYLRYQTSFPWDGWVHGIHTEDWRYESAAKVTGSGTAAYWTVSLVSLHMTPTLLVFCALAPAMPAWTTTSASRAPPPPMGIADCVAISICVAAILLQWIADEQLRAFRTAQYGPQANLNTSSSSKAVLSTGVWRYSRHPNYFGECCFWFGIACVGVAAEPARQWYQLWGGALAMLAFFRVSASLTDRRMRMNRGKEFEKILSRTSALIPMPNGPLAAMF
jgi:steroid 5-alpha reductase family enzyme